MDFVSWSVFGILFILAEPAVGTRYLLAIGLAFIYPAVADYVSASLDIQLAALSAGVIVHMLMVKVIRRSTHEDSPTAAPSNLGHRVEVIEWDDEDSARVMYQGKEWQADKVNGDMPNADHGYIVSEQYGRLIISTKQAKENLS